MERRQSSGQTPGTRDVTLLDFLARRFISPILRTRWLRSPCVQVADYILAAQQLFEIGAVLGRKFHPNLPLIASLFTEPGQEEAAAEQLRDAGTLLLTSGSAQPQDFLDLCFKPETERLCQILGYGVNRGIRKIRKRKLTEDDALQGFRNAFRKGLGFGACAPALTHQLLNQSSTPKNWDKFRAGSDYLPSRPPPPKSLAEQEAEATALLKEYVEPSRPDLLFRLGLWKSSPNDFQQRFRLLKSIWGHPT